MRVDCRYCGHPVGSHDDGYGCSHWFRKSDWDNGLCGCSMTRRQLLQLDVYCPPELWVDSVRDHTWQGD